MERSADYKRGFRDAVVRVIEGSATRESIDADHQPDRSDFDDGMRDGAWIAELMLGGVDVASVMAEVNENPGAFAAWASSHGLSAGEELTAAHFGYATARASR